MYRPEDADSPELALRLSVPSLHMHYDVVETPEIWALRSMKPQTADRIALPYGDTNVPPHVTVLRASDLLGADRYQSYRNILGICSLAQTIQNGQELTPELEVPVDPNQPLMWVGSRFFPKLAIRLVRGPLEAERQKLLDLLGWYAGKITIKPWQPYVGHASMFGVDGSELQPNQQYNPADIVPPHLTIPQSVQLVLSRVFIQNVPASMLPS